MKGMNNRNGSKMGSEQLGAHSLVEFVREYVIENGEYPKLKDMPVVRRTIEYYFGSFAELLKEARLGAEQIAKRKSRKKRYCRYCKKLLPMTNWFFCPGTDCTERFAEKYEQIFSNEEVKRMERELHNPENAFTNYRRKAEEEAKIRKKMISKCKECPEKCKVRILEDHDETKMDVQCKKDFGVVIETSRRSQYD